MKKIKLNETAAELSFDSEYILNPTEKYVISVKNELEFQMAIMQSFQIMGPAPALKNYHAWLKDNNFNVDMPNPTNEFVAPYYGVKPLWRTAYSQGIVVKSENDDDYFIVMECSRENKGYKHSQIIVTLGGCL